MICATCGLPVPINHPFGPIPCQFEAMLWTPDGLKKMLFCTGIHTQAENAASPWFGFTTQTTIGIAPPHRVPQAFYDAFGEASDLKP